MISLPNSFTKTHPKLLYAPTMHWTRGGKGALMNSKHFSNLACSHILPLWFLKSGNHLISFSNAENQSNQKEDYLASTWLSFFHCRAAKCKNMNIQKTFCNLKLMYFVPYFFIIEVVNVASSLWLFLPWITLFKLCSALILPWKHVAFDIYHSLLWHFLQRLPRSLAILYLENKCDVPRLPISTEAATHSMC